jgi:hypothetical protein
VYKPDTEQLQIPIERADDAAVELVTALEQLVPPGEEPVRGT